MRNQRELFTLFYYIELVDLLFWKNTYFVSHLWPYALWKLTFLTVVEHHTNCTTTTHQFDYMWRGHWREKNKKKKFCDCHQSEIEIIVQSNAEMALNVAFNNVQNENVFDLKLIEQRQQGDVFWFAINWKSFGIRKK